MGKFRYITTTLPYVNASPHLGFALELVQADTIARFWRSQGAEVFFNTGTDEHGLKIYQQALALGVPPQTYVDESAARFLPLKSALNLSYDCFTRTTGPKHLAAASEFWRRAVDSGDIYKKHYQQKYCVGCELEKTDSELLGGRCPIHPNKELELISEENYFFRFSRYQSALDRLYKKQADFVVPETRFREIKAFIDRGLEDFSVSRLKQKMPWGIPVPGDDLQVMYVWFDALVNYISAIGWPEDNNRFKKWWLDTGGVIQFAGKDNLRQQAAMWQAMLLSAGLSPSRQVVIHGFITVAGQKMSKSLGNVVDPFLLVNTYGTDAVRYYLLGHTHPFEDSDYTEEKFLDVYNANLANGLGNLVSRVMKLAETHLTSPAHLIEDTSLPHQDFLSNYQFSHCLDVIWRKISDLDKEIQNREPFKKIKTDKISAIRDIEYLVSGVALIAEWLQPFLPETSLLIKRAIKENKLTQRLFPRR